MRAGAQPGRGPGWPDTPDPTDPTDPTDPDWNAKLAPRTATKTPRPAPTPRLADRADDLDDTPPF